jgi:solute carrier family 25 carnitine/acylcarnitine transporter 20/29
MKRSTQITFFVLILCLAIALSSAKIPSQSLESLSSFAAGGVGGGLSVLVGHPFDLVKVQHQTNGRGAATQKGTFATLREIVQKNGLRGMYVGVMAPLIAVAPIFATSFWGYDVGDKLVRQVFGVSPSTPLNLFQLALAGGFSAFPTAVVMVPAERIKCLLQTQEQNGVRGGGSSRHYDGFSDCATQLFRENGLSGLYKGTSLTLMRDVPGNMVYFGVYELAKRALGENPAAALCAGALAGISFWPVVLPMDCLKSRFQTGNYDNIGQVYTELMKEEGPGGLFNGIRPAMIRSAPANAISFMGAELTKKGLSKFY